ncbi:unnamed protein product [Echinostoma caproni]|uniref:Uncharacterized protein n=1 Tax=Echinostoma caproni TaxID=27848 RepID=A0A183A6L1_9TREM|nr:unnamed protein product [Echinostoma caproni]
MILLVILFGMYLLEQSAEGRAVERNRLYKWNGDPELLWYQRQVVDNHRGADYFEPWFVTKRDAYADMPWGRRR